MYSWSLIHVKHGGIIEQFRLLPTWTPARVFKSVTYCFPCGNFSVHRTIITTNFVSPYISFQLHCTFFANAYKRLVEDNYWCLIFVDFIDCKFDESIPCFVIAADLDCSLNSGSRTDVSFISFCFSNNEALNSDQEISELHFLSFNNIITQNVYIYVRYI